MLFYDSYNQLYLIYKHSNYLNINKNNEFVLLQTTQVEFNFYFYTLVQSLFHTKKSNVYMFCNLFKHFFNKEQIKMAENLIGKLQKFKFALSIFKHKVMLKYKKPFNETTLFFEPFKKQKIKIYELGCLYQFDILELYNIVESCYNYDEYEIPYILNIKNPYTNIKFSYHNIVYIYFELLKHGKNSLFFNLYFKCSFDKNMLTQLYHEQLYVNCMNKRYIRLSKKYKKSLLYQMINHYQNSRYKYFKNVNYTILHRLFSHYVKYYYIYKKICSNFTEDECISYRNYYENKFHNKLMEVHKKNPNFGKISMIRNFNGKYIKIINQTLF